MSLFLNMSKFEQTSKYRQIFCRLLVKGGSGVGDGGTMSSRPPGHHCFLWDLTFSMKLESVLVSSSDLLSLQLYGHKERESALLVRPVRAISRRDFI